MRQMDVQNVGKGMVYLIGAGPGDPGLITVKGREILRNCDIVVYDHLASEELLNETRPQCGRIYVGKQAGHHSMRQEEINDLLVRLAGEGKRVVRLKGGDPFVFGRGGEEIQALQKAGANWQVVPGVTSAVAVPECAGIPVTHRALSRSFHVITAHGKEEDMGYLNFPQLAELPGTLVFLMGLARLPRLVQGLLDAGKEGSCPAAVIENGSLSCQRTVRGTVSTIARNVLEAGLHTPAVIVIGETAALDFSGGRKKEERRKVAGIVGTGRFCDRMKQAFLPYEISVRQIGELKVRPLLEEMGEQVYGTLKDDTVLCFTSANGVRLFFKGLMSEGMDARNLSHMKIAAVGEGTQAALREFGLLVDWMPAQYTTRDLACLLREKCGPEDCVLIPRSAEGSRDLNRILDQGKLRYKDIPIYKTDGMELDHGQLQEVDYLIFGSASGVDAFFENLDERELQMVKRVPIAAIGPCTLSALREHGICCALQAPVYTAGETARMVGDHLEHRGESESPLYADKENLS